MRKRNLMFLACLVCLLAFASSAQAETKVKSQWKCENPSVSHSLEAADQEGHAYIIQKVKCTATKGVIDGDQEKEGNSTEFHDALPDKGTWHGIFIETLASGDRIHYDFGGSGTMKDGEFSSGSNTWTIVGGTGRYEGATGEGGCTGKGSCDGTSTWDCKGTLYKKKR